MSDTATTPTPEQTAEETLTAEIKTLLKRYGLKRALVDKKTGETHFDASHIEKLEKKDAKLTGFTAIEA